MLTTHRQSDSLSCCSSPHARDTGDRGLGAGPERVKLLIIEDHRDIADSLRCLLELLGYQVRVAYNGRSGVKLALHWLPAIVLSDLGLPELDGFGVARTLRQHPATAETRLIAITGYGNDDDRQRSRAAGFDFHLTKPVALEDLQPLLPLPEELPMG
jgi:CheY-like chemotaxis protein